VWRETCSWKGFLLSDGRSGLVHFQTRSESSSPEAARECVGFA
jgi:hypothetical protein